MILYSRLQNSPDLAPRLIGMSLTEFDSLFQDFQKIHTRAIHQRQTTLRDSRPRLRGPGGGHRFKYDLQDRLLMALFWMATRPTYSTLGQLYGLHRCSVEKMVRATRKTLQELDKRRFNFSHRTRGTHSSIPSLLAAFPELQLLGHGITMNELGGDPM